MKTKNSIETTNQKFPFGCLIIVALILVIAYLYRQLKKQQEAQLEKEIEYQQQLKQQEVNTDYKNLLPKDTVQYKKIKPLTPKQRREIEKESQYEFDIKEEASEQMDERGIDEDY